MYPPSEKVGGRRPPCPPPNCAHACVIVKGSLVSTMSLLSCPLYPPHNISSVYLTTFVRRSGRIINGMRRGGQPYKTPHFHSRHRHPPPGMNLPGSGLTASAPMSGVSAPACTNGVWPPLRPVSVAQKNKPSTMLSSNPPTSSWTARPGGSGP